MILTSRCAALSRLCAVVSVFALAVGALSQPVLAQDEAPVVKVSVAAAYNEELIDEVSFIGKGRAIDRVEIIARVDGFLQEVMVEDGVKVEEGQLLYQIEPDAYEATLEARHADLAQAEAKLELAGIELARKVELARRGTAPQSEEDKARANELVAQASVQAAHAAIRTAELDLSYTQIHAPFPGRIGTTTRSVGDIVGPNTPALVLLVREQPIQVEFSVSEKQIVNLVENGRTEEGESFDAATSPDVFVTLPNGSQLEESGKVVFIDNRVDPTTGTIALRAEFTNDRQLIIDGAFLDVTIQALEPDTRLLVPQAAVQRDQRGDFVLVVTSDALVEQRYIVLGKQHETAVVVEDGMREGETVIVEGLQRVRPGVKVESVLAGQPGE